MSYDHIVTKRQQETKERLLPEKLRNSSLIDWGIQSPNILGIELITDNYGLPNTNSGLKFKLDICCMSEGVYSTVVEWILVFVNIRFSREFEGAER